MPGCKTCQLRRTRPLNQLRCFEPVIDAKLTRDSDNVCVHAAVTNGKLAADLLGGEPLTDQRHNLALSFGQFGRGRRPKPRVAHRRLSCSDHLSAST